MLPFIGAPFPMDDIEAYVNRYRWDDKVDHVALTQHRIQFYCKFFHPNRECNDSIIYDAEFFSDIYKRIDEQRHETAMQCVSLGIFKDIYEAQEGKRKKMIADSDYKYKHLLYRD